MKVIAGIIVTALIISGCTEKKEVKKQEKVIPVKIMEVSGSALATTRNYVGTIEESISISLSFSGMGTVEQVMASEGQRVHKGQLLATLNATTAQNSYDAAQAKLVQAQDAYDRLAKVHAEGSLPDIKFAEIEAGLQQAKSMANVAKKSLDDCRLYAPRDGAIASRNIEVGTNVIPGMAAFKLVAIDKVNVKIPVPENEIGNITMGQPATVVVPALDNAVFTGKVETKGIAADVLSHTYEAKIGIDNPQKILMPGMVCKVETVHAPSLQAKIVVPNRAIQISPNGKRYVWLAVMEDDNPQLHAQRRFVNTGDLTNDGIIVSEGLSAGDKIIVEGFQKICEGTRLNCVSSEL
ncbi:MAG: efflux RND transporter periplasmic adaptor subunit [Dysgonamonadaceae bacterium]|jgi:RND family efflux transporter MFP subunit|nr:efflux RND transporter periplasmic adaptor subunit [Dysgonamonadaceae bacterium]